MRDLESTGPQPEEYSDRWDRVADAYDREYRGEYSRPGPERDLLDHLILTADRSLPLLDLGCGPGNASRYLADHGLRPVGVDFSPQMLSIARRRNPDVPFVHIDLTRASWQPRSLGGAFSLYSIIHFTHSEAQDFIARVARALTPGAPFAVVSHAGSGTHRSSDVLGQAVDLEITLYTRSDLVVMFTNTGLTVQYAHDWEDGGSRRVLACAIAT